MQKLPDFTNSENTSRRYFLNMRGEKVSNVQETSYANTKFIYHALTFDVMEISWFCKIFISLSSAFETRGTCVYKGQLRRT